MSPGEGWTQSGTGDASATATYGYYYNGSGGGTTPAGDFYFPLGTSWTIRGESGSGGGTYNYDDALTLGEDGWSGASSTESGNPSVSGTSSQTDSYGYHSSGSTTVGTITSGSIYDITENGTTTTTGSGWPGSYATSGTTFGGSGSASGTYTTNNNYAPNPYATIDQVNDSWSPGSDGSSTAATISGTLTTYSNDPPNSTSYGPTTASPLNYIPDPWPAFGGPGPEPGAAGVYTAVISQIVPTGGGVNLPGGGDGDGNPAIAASQWDPNSFTYLFGQPTLPTNPSGLLILSPLGGTIILPAPADATTYSLAAAGEAVLGMDFAPVAGNGAAQFALLSPSPPDLRRPETRFGQGNNPASLPALTTETIAGAADMFGEKNVANAVPETKSSVLTQYATESVIAGPNAPTNGELIGQGKAISGRGSATEVFGIATPNNGATLEPVCFPAGIEIELPEGATKVVERIEEERGRQNRRSEQSRRACFCREGRQSLSSRAAENH